MQTDLDALDLKRMFHPNTNLAALHRGGPLVLVRGRGVHVWDNRGKQYIEAMAGLWCTTLGYGDDELARTAYEQIKKLSFSHLFTGKSHEPGILLADKLVGMAPFAASRVFFGNSGSDANDTQIKLVWYYNNALGRPKKKKIIARTKGYHGTTLASAGLTGLPSFHKLFDVPLPPFLHTDAPYYYRGAAPGESEDDYATRLAASLEQLILREGPDTVAAFIAEPLMGVGGVLLPPRGYFPKIQAVLAKYDVLLIDDEVITGFGRTGELWGAQAFGMQPHTLTAAKALSSAYLPISAVIVPEFLYDADDRSERRGRPVRARLHVLGPSRRGRRRAARARHLRGAQALRARAQDCAAVPGRAVLAWPRIRSSATRAASASSARASSCETKRRKRAFDAKLAVGAKCMQLCQEHGLIVRAIGDVIALCPPFIVTPSDVDEIFTKLRRGLDDTLAWAKRERLL